MACVGNVRRETRVLWQSKRLLDKRSKNCIKGEQGALRILILLIGHACLQIGENWWSQEVVYVGITLPYQKRIPKKAHKESWSALKVVEDFGSVSRLPTFIKCSSWNSSLVIFRLPWPYSELRTKGGLGEVVIALSVSNHWYLLQERYADSQRVWELCAVAWMGQDGSWFWNTFCGTKTFWKSPGSGYLLHTPQYGQVFGWEIAALIFTCPFFCKQLCNCHCNTHHCP